MDKKLIVIGIVFIIIFLGLCGCITEFSEKRRSEIQCLSISSDGSKLISTTKEGNDLQVWDIPSGEVIYHEYDSYSYFPYLSPNGMYFVSQWGDIYNATSGELILNTQGYIRWLSNSDNIILFDCKSIGLSCAISYYILYNLSNFSNIKETNIEKRVDKLAPSPNGSQLAIFQSNSYTISVLDITTQNATYIWNKTIATNSRPEALQWSDNNTIWLLHRGITELDEKNHTIWDYHLMVFNPSNGSIIYNQTIANKNRTLFWIYLSSNIEKYISYDPRIGSVKLFNLSGLEKSITFDFTVGGKDTFTWSPDSNTIAIGGTDGIIRIFNINSQKLIRTLKTPIRKITYPIPG